MLKRITAGLASLALAAGFGLAIATPANAQTQMTDTLCAMNEEGQATVTCRISVEESSITEGGEVNVSIRGAQDANVAIALFGPTIDGLVQIGEALPITIADESTAVDVTLPVPVLSGGHEGGRNFWVALADTPSDAEQVFGDRLTVASHRASVASVFGGGSETNPFRLRLDGGIEGDEFKVQAFVNDAWVDFTNVESEPIDENGSGALQVVSPAVERGEYPVRLYNTTQDLPGAEGIYRLLFGVEPEPTPEPTEEPTVEPTEEPTVEPTEEPTVTPTEEPTVTPTDEPTVTPTDEPTVTPTDEPTVTPTDEPTIAPTPTTSPTQDPGNRPGLPDTGVNA